MHPEFDLFSGFQDEPQTVLFLDTETTGADTGEDHMVELALVLCPYRGIHPSPDTTEFTTLVKPPIPVPPEASAVHHITDRMLENAPSLPDLRAQVRDLAEQASFLAAHNLPFDLAFLQRAFPEIVPRFPENRRLDTLRMARHCWPDIPSHALQALRYRFGLDELLPQGDAHRALFDARLAKALLDTALRMNLTGSPDLHALAAFIAGPLEVKIFTFGKHKGCLVEDIAATDPDYIRWLLRQDWLPTEYPDLYHTLLRKAARNDAPTV